MGSSVAEVMNRSSFTTIIESLTIPRDLAKSSPKVKYNPTEFKLLKVGDHVAWKVDKVDDGE